MRTVPLSASVTGETKSTTAALDTSPPHRRLLYWFTYLAALAALIILHLALDDLRLAVALADATSAGFVYSYYLAPRYRPLTVYVFSLFAAVLSVFYFFKIQEDVTKYGNYLGVFGGIALGNHSSFWQYLDITSSHLHRCS